MINKRDALDQFHGEKPVVGIRHQFVQSYQIRMRNIGERAKLSFKAIDVGSFGPGQSFQRYHFVHLAIVRFINDAHAACTQTAKQGEALSTDEFSGGLYHVGTSDAGATVAILIDRCAIVPYMICAIKCLEVWWHAHLARDS